MVLVFDPLASGGDVEPVADQQTIFVGGSPNVPIVTHQGVKNDCRRGGGGSVERGGWHRKKGGGGLASIFTGGVKARLDRR
jgi:hypothetical protein